MSTERANALELFAHQQEEFDRFGRHQARGLLWEPRVGKTRAVIVQMAEFYNACSTRTERIVVDGNGQAEVSVNFRALVICPKNVAPVWIAEFDEAWPSMRVVDLSSGQLLKRRATLVGMPPRQPAAVIVNDEVLHELIRELRAWNPTWVVADESHRFKSAGARRSRALHMLNSAPMRRILTGTPDPQSYVDFYSQYKFLAPGLLASTKAQFEERYVNRHPIFKSRVLSYKNQPELQAKIFSVSTRLRRADCRGVPQVQEVVRKIPLPEKARATYDDIVKKQVANVDGIRIDGRHTLVRMLRLAQLTSGFVPDGTDEGTTKWIHEAKTAAVVGELGEIVESGKRAVVFYRFRPEGDAIARAVEKARIGPYGHLSGAMPAEDRAPLIERFNSPDPNSDLRILIVQEQIGSLGISLAGADYAIFSTMSFDYAAHTQARDRIWKPDGKLCYVYLIAPKTIDEFVLKTLRRKKSASTALLDSDAFARAALGDE